VLSDRATRRGCAVTSGIGGVVARDAAYALPPFIGGHSVASCLAAADEFDADKARKGAHPPNSRAASDPCGNSRKPKGAQVPNLFLLAVRSNKKKPPPVPALARMLFAAHHSRPASRLFRPA